MVAPNAARPKLEAPRTVAAAEPARPAHLDAATWQLLRNLQRQSGCLLGVSRLGPIKGSGETEITDSAITIGKTALDYPDAVRWWQETHGVSPALIELHLGEHGRGGQLSPRLKEVASTLAEQGLTIVWRDMPGNFGVKLPVDKQPEAGNRVGGITNQSGEITRVVRRGPGQEAFTEYYRQLAKELAALGRPCVFRPFKDMNTAYAWWGDQPDDFSKLWRAARDIFQAEGAGDVLWCWSPSLEPAWKSLKR